MNRNRRQVSGLGGGIPSLFDIPDKQTSSYGSSSYGNSQSASFGSSYSTTPSLSSSGMGLSGGLSVAESFSTPMGYGSNYSQSSSSSLLGSGSRSMGDGLLGNGFSSRVGRGTLGSSGLGGGLGSSGFATSGLASSGLGSSSLGTSLGGGLSDLGGLGGDESFAAKVLLQQAMLAEEKQKSVQQQIQEQLERQNRKRLEYNRMKRDRENRRRDDRRYDDRRHDDRKRDGSKDDQDTEGLDDVHVTIKPRSEGRAVSDNTGGRKRNLSDRSRNQQGDQNSKKASSGDNASSSLQGPWKCHVCVVTCRDMKGYELHMKGRKHSEAMERMRLVTEYQAQQAVKRFEVEKHMKKVQGRSRDDDDHYCRDCLTHFSGHVLEHRRTKEHKEARRTQRPHCRVCNVTFKTAKKYVAHCNTPGHKKVYEAAKQKGEKDIDQEDFVTVDSVGVFDDEEACDEALLAANIGEPTADDNLQTNLGEGFGTTITVTKANSDDDVIIDEESEPDPPQMVQESSDPIAQPAAESTSDVFASSADESGIDDLVTAQLVSEPDSMITEDSSFSKPSGDESMKSPQKKKKKEDEHDDLSEYDPNKPVGRHHVIPVWGYFCKPCRKFYQSVGSQGSVLDAHCKTREHYDSVKFIMGKEYEEDTEDDTDYLSLAIAQNQEMPM